MTLLEREAELAAIDEVVGSGGVVLIEGGAGIGKTSLLGAAVSRAVALDRDILRARGSELEQGFAFGVVRQLFERRVAEAPAVEVESLFAGAAAAAKGLLLGDPTEAAADDLAFAVLHGLYWLASNFAGRQHLVLAIDDAQWADPASLRWLAYLAPRLEGLALSLVLATRPTEDEATAASIRELRADAILVRPQLLSRAAASTVVREALGAAAGDELCAAIWRESGGNPFYLQELLRSDARPEIPDADVDAATLLVHAGKGVSEHVAARVRALDPHALRLAQALAVLGDGCELRHAAAMAEVTLPEAGRLAAGLVRVEVLANDDPIRFLHPIVRQAVEASLGNDQRDADHGAAARALHADRAPAGMVAAHILRTRSAGDPWVVLRLREAATNSVESGDPQTAVELLRRAIAEPPPASDRGEVLRETGRAAALAGQESSSALLEEAMRTAVDPRDRARIGLELAEAYGGMFRWVEAVEACERALAELGDTDPGLSSRIEANMVVCGLRDSRRALGVLPVLERLAACPLQGGAAEAYAVARGIEGLWFAGRSADQISRPLEAAFTRAGARPENWDLRAPGLWALVVSEGFGAAQATLDGMLGEVQRSGSARGMFVTYALLGFLQLRLGALPEADANGRIALRVMKGADFGSGLALGLHVLADVAIEAGDLDEAEALLRQMPRTDMPPGLSNVHVAPARARLLLAQGRAADALAEFELGQSMLSEQAWGSPIHDNGFVHIRSGAAQALLRLGDRQRAVSKAESELEDARLFGAPRAVGIALRVAGLARGGEDGLRMLEEAVEVHRRSPALLERAHSLAEYGSALRRAGQRAAARLPLAESLDLAARCGARRLAARVREELLATGARPRREWRTGAAALTPSELRVARLAADGMTNREIAQMLYVTVKTIEGHLAHIYTKLEIAGREELRQGLEGQKSGVRTL